MMSDLISRQKAVKALGDAHFQNYGNAIMIIQDLPSAEPEIIRCKDCRYYDPAHVEKDGKRFEYSEFPKEAFSSFDNLYVSMAYGINVGGKCKYEKYGTDISVFRSEDDYCSKAWRKGEG